MSDQAEINFTFDGEPLTARPGETILQAALRNGKFIPHYCWHPGLSVAGNCRMCLCHVKPGPPKPAIACSTPVSEGMEVDGSSAQTQAAREGVLEFLLANHPLDCPVCDQAGECDLQQYSYDYGRSFSQFHERKNQKHRKDFGPLVRFNGNRCIACTRCVRFCQEVTDSHELTVVHRTEHATIDVFPGVPLDNPLSACVTDLCPVGALLETDSMHSTRVWLHRRTQSVCGGCATGCNINVETYNDRVRRVTPRENHATNRWWMCDAGRLSHHEAGAVDRLVEPRIAGEPTTPQAALDRAVELLGGVDQGRLAVLTTAFASNEELFLLGRLADTGPIGFAARPDGETFVTRDGFQISADKNPNRRGAGMLLGEGATAAKALAALGDRVQAVLIHDSVPGGAPWPAELVEALAKVPAVVAVSLTDTELAAKAHVALPAQHWTEKDGTFVNGRGRVQRIRAATPLSGGNRADLEVLQELARAAGIVPRTLSAGGVFRRLSAAHPATFGELSYRTIGVVGRGLPKAEDTTPPEACRTGYEAGPVSRHPGRSGDEQARIPVHRESPVGYGTVEGNV